MFAGEQKRNLKNTEHQKWLAFKEQIFCN